MKLSIITINYNNAEGLRKTLASVAAQTYKQIEHVIIDGGSTDESVDIIKEYAASNQANSKALWRGNDPFFCHSIIWVSEKDNGIYHAMNKGICKATGSYLQFLNSGDTLASSDVTERMISEVENAVYPAVLYGNMFKCMPNGKRIIDRCEPANGVSLNMFYHGCLNHSPAYIRRDLFDKYGLYDESLKICSDWKFYLQSLVLGGESVKHVDIDVTIFDMNGISETRKDILNEERNRLLNELVPQGILKDYDRYHFPMSQYDRLKRHHLWGLVWFLERVLFKLEKWRILR